MLRRARSPRGEDAAEGLAEDPHHETPTERGQAGRTATTDRVGRPGATAPIPTWIHTVADAAWIGWFDQMVAPLFTRCCTQAGDDAGRRAGSRPTGARAASRIWICSSPSKIQSAPKPIRRIRRAAGSGEAFGPRRGNEACPWALSLRYWTVRNTLKPTAHRHNEHENDDELMEERCVEARDDQGVARLERAAHAGHRLLTSLGRS